MGKGKAIASMVCGILAVILWPISLILGVIALVFGIIVVRRKEDGRGMAIAGIVTGIVGVLIGVLFILLLVGDLEAQAMRQTAENTRMQVCDDARSSCLQKCSEQWLFKDSCRVDCYDEHTRCIKT